MRVPSRKALNRSSAIALLLAAGVCPPALGAEESTDLSVITYNIRYGTANDGDDRWERRRDLAVDVLRRHAPDVVGLQEALRFQIDEIRGALPAFGEIGVGRDDGKEKGEYSAILYRTDRLRLDDGGTFWLSDTPEVPGSRSWGNSITRICTWARFIEVRTGIAFYVFNVHLDHQSQPSRVESSRLLARRIASRAHPDPAIVTGDFNAGEDNPAVVHLKGDEPGCRLVDTFRVLHADAVGVGTFHGFKGGTTGQKIDYVLVPSWVRTLEAAIIRDASDGRYPSDHFPVVAKVRVPRVRRS